MQQNTFYDAFVQFSHVLHILGIRLQKEPKLLLNIIRAHAWIGSIFQDLIHYAQPGKGTLLQNFINRYNRDHADDKKVLPIAVFRRNDEISIRKTKKDLITLANHHFSEIERIGEEINSSGYTVTSRIIVSLEFKNFRQHLLNGLKAIQGHSFNTMQELKEKLSLVASPPPNQSQIEFIWKVVITDSDNKLRSFKQRLRHQRKWLEVYSDAMLQIAKNYEFLGSGDQSLKYSWKSYSILNPWRMEYPTKQKKILRFIV